MYRRRKFDHVGRNEFYQCCLNFGCGHAVFMKMTARIKTFSNVNESQGVCIIILANVFTNLIYLKICEVTES